MKLFLKLLFGGVFVFMVVITIRTGLAVSLRTAWSSYAANPWAIATLWTVTIHAVAAWLLLGSIATGLLYFLLVPVLSAMRKGTPKSDQENVITVYGGTDSWKQRVGYLSPDAAYLVLLDKHGVVRWRHGGAFDEKAYRDLHAQVSDLLREP